MVALAASVTTATYVLWGHSLQIKPGLLQVQLLWVHPDVADLLTVTVRRGERVITNVAVGPAGGAFVPDLPFGTYRVSLSYLDVPMAEHTTEIREDNPGTWLRTIPLGFVPPPPGSLARDIPASRPDPTDREVAREVYALVIGHLIERIGSRALIERETAHSGGVAHQNAAHGIIPLDDSIRRALREPTDRQVVWHHARIFPSTVIAVNKAELRQDVIDIRHWQSMLGLVPHYDDLHILSVSRVFVSNEGTQAIVFTNDQGHRGNLFWLRRTSPAAPWHVERVQDGWIS